MAVLMLTHQPDAPSGVFGEVARSAGHRVEEAAFATDAAPARSASAYDGLVVFGGRANVHEEADHPWLRDEKAFLREAIEADVPVLGVCLGSQLLADALGARVFRADRPENGWVEVRLAAAAADDPLLGGIGPGLCAAEWHSYTFELPPDSVELARSDACIQAFRHGRVRWGIQFHAEVTRSAFETWIDKHDGDPALDLAAIRRETRGRMAGWNETGSALCRRFLDVCEASAAARLG